MDPELVKRSLNYHGQQMTRIWGVERGNKPLQGFNVKDLDYNDYQKRAKELAMQDRTKRVKIQHFIVEKAERLFKPAEPSPNVIITPEEQEAIVHLPPLESLLNVSAEDRSNSLQDVLKVGDIVVGHVLWHHHATLGVKVLALDGGKKRDLSDLNIKGFVSESNVPPHEGSERAYHLNDVLRLEVGENRISNFHIKLHLGLKGVYAPPHVLALYPLGKIDPKLIDMTKKLPQYLAYDTKRGKGWTFDDAFEESPEWENPESMSILAKSLGIVSTGSLKETYTHMVGLAAISPLDMAPNLRKTQAVKWAHKHVAEGIAYFKKGNETEAFQCLNKALQIDPCNVEGSVARGALYANHANFDKAVEDFMTALKENPFHANAQKYLAETLCAQGKQHEDDKKNDEALLSYQHCLAIMPHHSEAREAITALVAYLKWQNSHFEVRPLSPTDPFQVVHDRVYQSENVEAIDAVPLVLNRTWSPDVEVIRELSPKPKERSLSPFSKKMAMLESFDQETRSSGIIENVPAVSEKISRSPSKQAVEQQAEKLKVREGGKPNLLPSAEVVAETPLSVPPPSFALPPPFVHGVHPVQPDAFGAGLSNLHGDFQTQPSAFPGSLVNPFLNIGNTSQPPPVFPTQVPPPVPVQLPAQIRLQPPPQETRSISNAYDEQVRLFLEKIESKKGDLNRGYKEEKRYREYSRERTERKEKKKKRKYRSESESSDSEEIVKKKKKKKHSYSPRVTHSKEVKILDKPKPKGLLPELDDFPNIDDLQSKLSSYYQKISSKEDKREVPLEKRIIMRNLRERKSYLDSSSSAEEEDTSRIKEAKMKEEVELISEKKGADREIKKDEYAVDVDTYFSSLNRLREVANKKLRKGFQLDLAVKKGQEGEKRPKLNLWRPNRDEPTCSSGIHVPQPRRRSRSREEADRRRAKDERGRSRTREERGRSKTREGRDIRRSKDIVSESRRSGLQAGRRRSRSRGRSRSREHRGKHESRSGYNELGRARCRKSSVRSRRSEERKKIERSSDWSEPPRNARGTRSPVPAASYSVVFDPAFGNFKKVFQKDEPQPSRSIKDRLGWSKSATEKRKESPGKDQGLVGEKSQIDMFAPEEKDLK